jgi:hypothetical protein
MALRGAARSCSRFVSRVGKDSDETLLKVAFCDGTVWDRVMVGEDRPTPPGPVPEGDAIAGASSPQPIWLSSFRGSFRAKSSIAMLARDSTRIETSERSAALLKAPTHTTSAATFTVREEYGAASRPCTDGNVFVVELELVYIPVTLDGGFCKVDSAQEEDTAKQPTLEDCTVEVVGLYSGDENRERSDCIMLLTLPIVVFGLG